MSKGFDRLHDSVNVIDRKIDDLRVDVAKNYVTNDQLTNHIQSEEGWHLRFGEEMTEMRDEVTTTRVIVDRMWLDFQNRGKL
jgi:predicted metalloprotease